MKYFPSQRAFYQKLNCYQALLLPLKTSSVGLQIFKNPYNFQASTYVTRKGVAIEFFTLVLNFPQLFKNHPS